MGANMDSAGWGRGETEVGITRHQQSLKEHYSKLTDNQLGKGGGGGGVITIVQSIIESQLKFVTTQPKFSDSPLPLPPSPRDK